jgi:alpha-mannosidase
MRLQILTRRERVALLEAPRAYPRADRVAEVRALGWVERMPGYAAETRDQRRRAAPTVPDPVRVDGLSLENGHLRVSVTPQGDVRMTDLTTGRALTGLLSFEQRVEAGDLYTTAPREFLATQRVSHVRPTLRGPLRGEISLQYTFGDRGRGRGRCTVRLQLDAALPALRVAVDGENRDGDHRLRLCIATGIANAATLADAAFFPVRREPLVVPAEDQRDEQVVPTAPLHRWVARFDDEAGVSIFSDGLTEYESLKDGTVAVTLFRAVSELSRADLPERPGHAGWPARTPGAQALGAYSARLAVAMHGAEDWRTRDQIERLADDVLLPIRGETLRYNLDEPLRAGGLELDGEGLAFSAALPAQAAGWTVLRCVNRRDLPTRGWWRLGKPLTEAVRARLDETPETAVPVLDGTVAFDAAPHEIVTILVR